MSLSRSRGGLAAVTLLAITAGMALPALEAGAQHRPRDGDGARYRDGTRGTITLGGRHGEFWFHDDPCHSLVTYFTDCGYNAWIDEGRVLIRCSGGRTRVSLHASGFAFSVRYVADCIVIEPRCLDVVAVRSPIVCAPATVRWTSRDWCPPAPRWGRTRHAPLWSVSFSGRPTCIERAPRRAPNHHRERRSRRCR